jgi:hypothetical protein
MLIILKCDLQEVGWVGMGCNAVGQERDWWWDPVNAVMNFKNKPSPSVNCREFLG